MIVLVALWLSLLFFVIVLLWNLIPALYGLPSVAAKPERIRNALKLANLSENEMLYDLGAGDGRVLLIASRDFGARAVGLEVGPIQCIWVWLRITAAGLGDRIRVRWKNFYKADLQDADVVYVYATSREVTRIASHLEKQMRKGSRLVSISADFPEWEPSSFDDHDLIFVYEMPPKKGSLSSYLFKREE